MPHITSLLESKRAVKIVIIISKTHLAPMNFLLVLTIVTVRLRVCLLAYLKKYHARPNSQGDESSFLKRGECLDSCHSSNFYLV